MITDVSSEAEKSRRGKDGSSVEIRKYPESRCRELAKVGWSDD